MTMAKQSGLVQFEGTIGNITFFKTNDGFKARQKGGISKTRMKTDPAFERTRENWAEFGRAGKAGKLLRNAYASLIKQVADKQIMRRLIREMVKVVKADAINIRGARNVMDGETALLQGFEFNQHSPLSTALKLNTVNTIDRATGTLQVDVPAIVPGTDIVYPTEATHFVISIAGAEVDFESGRFVSTLADSGMLSVTDALIPAIQLRTQVTAASTHPLFLALGIAFFQDVNGAAYPLNNGAYNAFQLVMVSGQ